MATFTYRCTVCGKSFDHSKKISDPHPDKCKSCNASGVLSQVITAASLHFKGKWFATSGCY